MKIKPDFDSIERHCKQNSLISAEVIDKNIRYYAAAKENLSNKFDRQMGRYKHITRNWDKSVINLFKSQYIVSQVFKKEGFIRKFMNHSAIKLMPAEQLAFLEAQMSIPWRHCFSQIKSNPHPNFFKMIDAFTEEEYLLYSPGMQLTYFENTPSL